MTRAAIVGGPELVAACAVLGLSDDPAEARLVVADLRVPGAAARAATLPASLPRIIVAGPEQAEALGALGTDALAIAPSGDPAALGPLVARLLPRPVRERSRVVTLTAARGGSGRTLCAANLARRLSASCSVVALDATGTGALGWWLGAAGRPWAELEAVAGELDRAHLDLVATVVGPRLRLVGGPPAVPSRAVLGPAIAAARASSDLVLIDAPLLADERLQLCAAQSDRVLVLSYADPASAALLGDAAVPDGAWIIGAQGPLDGAFRTLPRDERAVGEAVARPGAARGALGRAYDDLAELLSIDAT